MAKHHITTTINGDEREFLCDPGVGAGTVLVADQADPGADHGDVHLGTGNQAQIGVAGPRRTLWQLDLDDAFGATGPVG